ncbi:MAG: helix-turn-helix transcriptional regulator [Candidatus Rokubacteria bacterium]|nr:helix-turn-helix transcriptional regulator [Candidatus Rokubacteria bacterium]
MAKSLELVGERWTLLIVRDLLEGPRRFQDFHASLPGIAPKLLSERATRACRERRSRCAAAERARRRPALSRRRRSARRLAHGSPGLRDRWTAPAWSSRGDGSDRIGRDGEIRARTCGR